MIMLGKSTNEKNIKLKFRSKQNIVKDNMVRKMYKIYSKNWNSMTIGKNNKGIVYLDRGCE